MLIDSSSSQRCIFWFGEPTAMERQLVAASGWSVRVIAPQSPLETGRRLGDVAIGLFDMRQDFARYIDQAEAWMQQTEVPEAVLALTAKTTPECPRLAGLLAACAQTFAMPLDAAGFSTALNKAVARQTTPAPEGLDALIGESAPMLAIKASVRRFAPIDLPVLITGDTGTGKEVAARALHSASPRHSKPFAAVNCGALPAALVQSELFGHERGAFTGATARRAGLFEAANGGTVFLDEIGDLPLDAQTNLLRVLQEGSIERVGSHQSVKIDVRVLAATHVNLEQAVSQGRFREDLYYRLNVLRLRMPSLRERGNDVERLALHFLNHFRERHKVRPSGFSADARRALNNFSWPGNVRELLNRVQRAAIVADTALINATDLELENILPFEAPALHDARTSAEREALLGALHDCNWNVSACARRMRVSRVTVYRLCRKHQVALDGTR